ncbi:hypothetical protein BLNAU_5540 [Blattamonas nauphoetae]|uniref:Uncharacterized protein n=1 Tax=Blattamonas nauphoetae TaxID=2049346 RepID=A0ABQ9Y6W5_9EUKA|nr:hypothetical protein BLNAU_5540 [Blattamonas nauphoetae]
MFRQDHDFSTHIDQALQTAASSPISESEIVQLGESIVDGRLDPLDVLHMISSRFEITPPSYLFYLQQNQNPIHQSIVLLSWLFIDLPQPSNLQLLPIFIPLLKFSMTSLPSFLSSSLWCRVTSLIPSTPAREPPPQAHHPSTLCAFISFISSIIHLSLSSTPLTPIPFTTLISSDLSKLSSHPDLLVRTAASSCQSHLEKLSRLSDESLQLARNAIIIWDPTRFRREGNRIIRIGVIDSSQLENCKTGDLADKPGASVFRLGGGHVNLDGCLWESGNMIPRDNSDVTVELDINRRTLVLFVDGEKQPHAIFDFPHSVRLALLVYGKDNSVDILSFDQVNRPDTQTSSNDSNQPPLFLSTPFLRIHSLIDASPFFLSLVQYLKTGNTLGDTTIPKTEALLKQLNEVLDNHLLRHLLRDRLDLVASPVCRVIPTLLNRRTDGFGDFRDTVLTLVTSGCQNIVTLSLRLLRLTVSTSPKEDKFSLVGSGLFVQLATTLSRIRNSLSADAHLNFIDAISYCAIGRFSQDVAILSERTALSTESIHQSILEQLVQPVAPYVFWVKLGSIDVSA